MDKPVYEIPDMSDSEAFGWTPRPLSRRALREQEQSLAFADADAAAAAPLFGAAPQPPAAPVPLVDSAAQQSAPVPLVDSAAQQPNGDPAPTSDDPIAEMLEQIHSLRRDAAAVPDIAIVREPEPIVVAAPEPEASAAARADWAPDQPADPDDLAAHALTAAERAALESADRDLIASLHEVVAQNASDLHVTANAAPMLRVDGGLRPALAETPWSRERVARALDTLLTDEQRERFAEHLELDFAYTISANARFRVNYYQQRGAIGAAFRLIPTEIKTLGQLGVPEIVGEFSKLPRGLVLVTGPTGSGKSTTLAALIDLANSTRSDHIVTVEDPIEFLHKHKSSLVNQREVGNDTHSFANALKHVLRQDPDIILIGELRDLETIQVALTAAETGHLVFATLHTQDAPQTIDRVIDVFPPHQQGQVRTQLAATLQGVVCQTLVKRASGAGRVVATEIMITTPAIANLIREGKTYQIASMMQAGGDAGMHTMDQHLADLVNAGTIRRKAAEEKVHDPEGFHRLVSRMDSPSSDAGRALAASGPDFGDSFSGQAY
jgi:twitching motility protein PilT